MEAAAVAVVAVRVAVVAADVVAAPSLASSPTHAFAAARMGTLGASAHELSHAALTVVAIIVASTARTVLAALSARLFLKELATLRTTMHGVPVAAMAVLPMRTPTTPTPALTRTPM